MKLSPSERVQLALERGPATSPEIGERTGLTATAITAGLRSLLEAGTVITCGRVNAALHGKRGGLLWVYGLTRANDGRALAAAWPMPVAFPPVPGVPRRSARHA